MSELWRPSEHEPLAAAEWDEARAEEAIRTIVADAEAAFDGTRWPFHPADGEDNGPTTLYLGSAGVIWARAAALAKRPVVRKVRTLECIRILLARRTSLRTAKPSLKGVLNRGELLACHPERSEGSLGLRPRDNKEGS